MKQLSIKLLPLFAFFLLLSCEKNNVITLDSHLNYIQHLDTHPLYIGKGGSEWRNGWGGHLNEKRHQLIIVIDKSKGIITIPTTKKQTFKINGGGRRKSTWDSEEYYQWNCDDGNGNYCEVSLSWRKRTY